MVVKDKQRLCVLDFYHFCYFKSTKMITWDYEILGVKISLKDRNYGNFSAQTILDLLSQISLSCFCIIIIITASNLFSGPENSLEIFGYWVS